MSSHRIWVSRGKDSPLQPLSVAVGYTVGSPSLSLPTDNRQGCGALARAQRSPRLKGRLRDRPPHCAHLILGSAPACTWSLRPDAGGSGRPPIALANKRFQLTRHLGLHSESQARS
jgi:hypothetical protein